MVRTTMAVLATGAALLAGIGSAQAQDITFAVTDVAGLENLQREFGVFREVLEEVTGLEIEFLPVNSYTAAVEAMAADQIDFVLFSLEKSTRSSVVLGLVGAGGIGLELKVAMDLFQYSTASTIILCVFVLVLAVEQASSWLRRRIL